MTAAHFHSTGEHVIVDLYEIDPATLCDAGLLETALQEGAAKAGATILFSHFHQFGEGRGITGVVLLAESHLSIHTWPESGFAALDIFMCGAASPQRALDVILIALAAPRHRVRRLSRGGDNAIGLGEIAA